ncbi:MAG: hypothetical protein H6Q00_2377, partial [Holophagaceae bacterium]|nr:hypothetical protein [Holophagaceae bacterium]
SQDDQATDRMPYASVEQRITSFTAVAFINVTT